MPSSWVKRIFGDGLGAVDERCGLRRHACDVDVAGARRPMSLAVLASRCLSSRPATSGARRSASRARRCQDRCRRRRGLRSIATSPSSIGDQYTPSLAVSLAIRLAGTGPNTWAFASVPEKRSVEIGIGRREGQSATRNAAAPGDGTWMRAARDPSGKVCHGNAESSTLRDAVGTIAPKADCECLRSCRAFCRRPGIEGLQRVALGGRRRLKRDRVRRRVSAEQHRAGADSSVTPPACIAQVDGVIGVWAIATPHSKASSKADVRGRQLSHIEDTPGCRRTPEGIAAGGLIASGSDARPSDAHRTDHATAASTPGSAGLARHVRRHSRQSGSAKPKVRRNRAVSSTP